MGKVIAEEQCVAEHIETPDDTLQFEYDADDNRVVRVSEDERTATYYVGDLFEEVVEVGQSQRPTGLSAEK